MKLKPLVILSTLWLLALAAHLELTDQEAYYWTWSTQPALCYFEHPPLQAWITHAFTFLLGDGAWVVRLPALLGRLFTLWIVGLWAKGRFGEKAAELSLWLMLGSFFFIAGSVIALPDSVMMPFAAFMILSAERRWAWRAGLALGLAGLAKWTAVLFVPGVCAAFLWRRPRDWRGLLKCGLTALALQTPVLVWNYDHHWASFAFHLYHRQVRTLPIAFWTYVGNVATFAGAQILLGGLSFAIGAVYAWKYFRAGERIHSASAPMPIGWWIWPFMLVFGLSSVRGELRFYWTSAAFAPIAVWLSAYLAKLPPLAECAFKRTQTVALVGSMTLLSVAVLLPVGAYVKPITDLYKPYDLRHSPRGDLKGWTEWVEEDLRPAGFIDAPDVVFFAADFRLAAQLAWAARIHDMTRIGVVGHDQAQFAFWPQPRPPQFKRAVMFEDNRHFAGLRYNDFCEGPIDWHQKKILLHGELVKEIRWGLCDRYKLNPSDERAWAP